MTTRKYIFEFGLHTYASHQVLLQQDHLDRVNMSRSEPHIYFICRRPRVGLDAAALKFTADIFKGRFFIQRHDRRQFVKFEIANSFGSNVRAECKYPYSEFRILDATGTPVFRAKTSVLIAQLGAKYWGYLDLEVLYIGQAYGTTGARTSADRLTQHSTLQQIYAQALHRSPDQEVWLILVTVEAQIVASFDGTSRRYGTTASENNAHRSRILRTRFSERQIINFTEAALIRYFQPPYNSLFKDSFPNPAHTTYSQCYDVDLNAVSTEIATDGIGCRLWTEAAPATWFHLCSFPLHSRTARIAMFEIPSRRRRRKNSVPGGD